MRGVIYARYSSDNQREESIEGQLRENTAYAKKNGIEIVGTYIDRAVPDGEGDHDFASVAIAFNGTDITDKYCRF